MCDLQLLKLSAVPLTLADHLSHLVIMFLLLVQSLGLLPLLLQPGELRTKEREVSERRTHTHTHAGKERCLRQALHLLDLLAVLRRVPGGVDLQALLEHDHACFALAALDLGESVLLLLLSSFEELNHALVIALHLFLFLNTHTHTPSTHGSEHTTTC